jgi:hypothetical protein
VSVVLVSPVAPVVPVMPVMPVVPEGRPPPGTDVVGVDEGRPPWLWLWLCICIGVWMGAIPVPVLVCGALLREGSVGTDGVSDGVEEGVGNDGTEVDAEGRTALGVRVVAPAEGRLVPGRSETAPASQFLSRVPSSGQVSSAQETLGGWGTSLPQMGQ